MHNKHKLLIGFSLLLPAIALAEGQRGLEEFVWKIEFFIIFGVTITIALVVFFIIDNLGKNKLNKKQTIFYWLTVLLLVFATWAILTFAQTTNN